MLASRDSRLSARDDDRIGVAVRRMSGEIRREYDVRKARVAEQRLDLTREELAVRERDAPRLALFRLETHDDEQELANRVVLEALGVLHHLSGRRVAQIRRAVPAVALAREVGGHG